MIILEEIIILKLERKIRMSSTQFNLKTFRENVLKMTQAELANALDLRQDNVSRMEKNPEQISYPIIAKMATLSGLTIDQVVGYAPPEPNAISVERTWTIGYDMARIKSNIQSFRVENSDLCPENLEMINDLEKVLNTFVKKPKVAIGGQLCVGKGTLANNLLGKKLIPVNAACSNPMVICIKHIDDRPAHLKDNVYIMRRSLGEECWDDNRLINEKECLKWIIDYGSVLKLSHNYKNACAVVYEESDILKNCDILTLPSEMFQHSDSVDASINFEIDILLYLLPMAFRAKNVDPSDLAFYLYKLRDIDDPGNGETGRLSNLFMIASKAKIFGTEQAAMQSAEAFVKQYYDGVSGTILADRQAKNGCEYGVEDFLKRLFVYDAYGEQEWRIRFESEFRKAVERLPRIVEWDIKSVISAYCSAICGNLAADIDRMESVMDRQCESRAIAVEYELEEDRRWSRTAQARDKVIDTIRKSEHESLQAFSDVYLQVISENTVKEMMEDNFRRAGADAVRSCSAKLADRLKRELYDLIMRNSKHVNKDIDFYIKTYEFNANYERVNSFSARNNFAVGLKDLRSVGALTSWMVSQGRDVAVFLPDIMKYAPSAKRHAAIKNKQYDYDSLNSFLDSQKESAKIIKSCMTFGLLGAGIGNPGILSAIVGAGIGSAIGAGNQTARKVFAKVGKLFSDHQMHKVYDDFIRKYWNDTLSAFVDAADNLEASWKKHITDINRELTTRSLEKRIAEARLLKSFFERLAV